MRYRFVPRGIRSSPVTEGRIASHTVSVAVLDLQAYLNRLASAEPTPGGGSAAALVGAFGAALVGMVARLTLGSSKHTEVHAEALLLVETADALRAQFSAARTRDEAAFGAVVAAQALPRASAGDKATRRALLQTALTEAAEAPLAAAALAATLLDACERAARLRNTHLMSDVECAIAFGRATLDASAANVRINHRHISDAGLIAAQADRLAACVAAAQGAQARATATVVEALR